MFGSPGRPIWHAAFVSVFLIFAYPTIPHRANDPDSIVVGLPPISHCLEELLAERRRVAIVCSAEQAVRLV